MMKSLTVLAAIALATPAVAQQTFAAPEGCTGTLTVQQKGCVMINVWTCEADEPGDQWVALISQAGVFSVQKVDREFQWLESFKPDGAERLRFPADDPASLTELFTNQIDTWDFIIETEEGIERNVGYDQLTGETTVIDGETLLNTEFQGRTLDGEGNVIENGAGRQFVSEKHRLFFFGEAWDVATPDNIIDLSPVEFTYPGEPGFFSARPKYECNVEEASFQP
ncbi:hypothetical protein [Yoonia sediminilitoris]|uniref:Uncharacterized protein n=1 Tax=Yoonia sediminilitoris TaxID=1286148 RepID=A0A2T6KLC1_9RHOB|nr:hypothetical protein [Yoonia sediminilitoris]PUB16996.1 hypothetical protein C8N45_1026 [Yoonia sediminilitoris]RCW97291.1 hypothetical protein DFP92_1026 [Yoonia sediminilitoris]